MMNVLHYLRATSAYPLCQKVAFAIGTDQTDALTDTDCKRAMDAIFYTFRLLGIPYSPYDQATTERLAETLTSIFNDLSVDDYARLRNELGGKLQ
jgi:hypothetical protein